LKSREKTNAFFFSSLAEEVDGAIKCDFLEICKIFGKYCLSTEVEQQIFYRKCLMSKNRCFFGHLFIPFSPQALFFDMDGTIVQEEGIVLLAEIAKKKKEVDEITKQCMLGQRDFREGFLTRINFLEGLPQTVFEKVSKHWTLFPGIKELVTFARRNHIPSFIISGGFQPFAEILQKTIGFHTVRAHHLEVHRHRLTGRLMGDLIDADGKRDWVIKQCRKHGFSPDRVICIGDGANDKKMFEIAGLTVGHRPKPVLWESCHIFNFLGDHRLLIKLLPYITRSCRDNHPGEQEGYYEDSN